MKIDPSKQHRYRSGREVKVIELPFPYRNTGVFVSTCDEYEKPVYHLEDGREWGVGDEESDFDLIEAPRVPREWDMWFNPSGTWFSSETYDNGEKVRVREILPGEGEDRHEKFKAEFDAVIASMNDEEICGTCDGRGCPVCGPEVEPTTEDGREQCGLPPLEPQAAYPPESAWPEKPDAGEGMEWERINKDAEYDENSRYIFLCGSYVAGPAWAECGEYGIRNQDAVFLAVPITPDQQDGEPYEENGVWWRNLGGKAVIAEGEEVSRFGEWIVAGESIGKKVSELREDIAKFKARRRVTAPEKETPSNDFPPVGTRLRFKVENYYDASENEGTIVTVVESLPHGFQTTDSRGEEYGFWCFDKPNWRDGLEVVPETEVPIPDGFPPFECPPGKRVRVIPREEMSESYMPRDCYYAYSSDSEWTPNAEINGTPIGTCYMPKICYIELIAAPLQLRVGAWYEDSEGEKIGPMKETPDDHPCVKTHLFT